MLENPDFEQIYCSRTSSGFYKSGLDSSRLMKRLAQYDRSYLENKSYFDLLGSFLNNLKEIIER